MTEAFLALPEEKQKAILDAAAAEFADYGYDQASTNRIVAAAGIGKGMLFYYFGCKQELYHTLIDRGCQMVEVNSEKILAYAGERGIMESIQYSTRIKMELYLSDPPLFDFLTRLVLHPEEAGVTEETRRRFEEVSVLGKRVVGELFAKANLTRLRRDIPPERLIQYISWGVEGYTQHVRGLVQSHVPERLSEMDFAPYWAEFDTYMEDLKTMFYEEE
ncbi:MAG: TetR/AcrR family transcriptional regulator [Oscillospiraceae bacterium]|nr:TetR/AcrR family transcriptional regulator [Oscillospiraceae bacterium]